ncbi:MAG: hypothetical protein FJ006_12990 [Chloroflexi bacterium]|nr:hypothetical protein [Chloroflexota bacterium]
MIQGEWKDAVIEKDGTVSAEVDLGRAYDTLIVIIPTIDEASVNVQVAEKTGGTFQDLYLTSLTDGDDDKPITTAGTGGATWTVPIGGFQFIKIKTSAAQTTAAVTFRVCGVRS